MKKHGVIAPTMLVLLCNVVSRAGELPSDACGAAYQREEVFEFAAAPIFRKTGQDQYEIRFASKGQCDVTVGIVDGGGTVVRHLACGVLGPNAPAPLKRDSLEQSVRWDGKNDLGRYVGSPEKCRVKVGLGLKPELEKILMHHPNRLTQVTYGLACDKDGVYVHNANNASWRIGGEGALAAELTSVQVYDHQGNYLRTIYPFPREKIKPEAYARNPLYGHGPYAGPEPAMKIGPPFSFVLPSGRVVISPDPDTGWGQGFYSPHIWENNAFVVDRGILTAVVRKDVSQQGLRFLRLGTDGSMPKEGYYSGASVLDGVSGPCWLGASPDGQWLYVSGLGVRGFDFHFARQMWREMKGKDQAEHAMYRFRYDKPAAATAPFLGVKGEPGNDNGHFRFPEGVACDQEGRIYVADSGNNRLQVFDAAGKFVKSLPVPEPYAVAVHRGNGAIYVASFEYKLGQLIITKFKGLSDAGAPIRYVFEYAWPTSPGVPCTGKANPKAAWPGQWQSMGSWLPVLCVDEWAPETTVWTLNPDPDVVMLVDKGDRFELKRNLQEEWRKEWKAKGWDVINPSYNLGNIAAEPNRPYIYVGDGAGLGNHSYIYVGDPRLVPRVNVETGEARYVPCVSAVGFDGLVYNSVKQRIWRFEPATGQSVAFDYGAGANGEITYAFFSGTSSGMGISPQGAVYLHDVFPPMPGVTLNQSKSATLGSGDEDYHVRPSRPGRQLPAYMLPDSGNATDEAKSLRGYKPRPMFPGGMYQGSSALLQFNENGQLENNNLIGGLPRDVAGVQVDFQGNVYVGICFAKPGADGKPVAGRAIAKFKPEGGRIMVNGSAVPVPLTETPKRPPDFLTMGYSGGDVLSDVGPDGKPGKAGDKAWAEGLLWSVGGYSWGAPARFALDYYGRLFFPEVHRNSVAIVDAGGNFMLRVGEYGNQDDRGPEIRLAYTRFVGVSETRLFINDMINKRILSVRLAYQKEAEAGMAQ